MKQKASIILLITKSDTIVNCPITLLDLPLCCDNNNDTAMSYTVKE